MVDKNSPIPLYGQLVDILMQKILSDMHPNDKMMSEREICNQYSVSRTTVRQALSELEQMGYIYRRHGKGTFIANPQQERQNLLNNYSFTQATIKSGRQPTTTILSFSKMVGNQYICSKMLLSSGATVYRLERLRLADTLPMMYEISYLPTALFPGLQEKRFFEKPLYDIVEQDYGQKISSTEEEFSASIVNDTESKFLSIPHGSPCLRLRRMSQNSSGQALEFTMSTARSDQFIYRIHY